MQQSHERDPFEQVLACELDPGDPIHDWIAGRSWRHDGCKTNGRCLARNPFWENGCMARSDVVEGRRSVICPERARHPVFGGGLSIHSRETWNVERIEPV